MLFNWGSGSPSPALDAGNPSPGDNFSIQWDGFITIPVINEPLAAWYFGTVSDDGAEVWVAGQRVIDDYNNSHGAPAEPLYQQPSLLNYGHTYPITVKYREGQFLAGMELWVKRNGTSYQVPASWFGSYNPLPKGWSSSNDLGRGVGYTSARQQGNSVVLTSPDGETTTFTANGTGFAPGAGEDGVLARAGDGTLTFSDTDGSVYTFTSSGELRSVTSPTDDLKPGALTYSYGSPGNGAVTRLNRITDPVTGHGLNFHYAGQSDSNNSCATDVPDNRLDLFRGPPGVLCRVEFAGIDLQRLWYDSDAIGAQLRVIENRYSYFPNTADVWEFGYSGGRIVSTRNPLQRDALAANAALGSTAQTTLAYVSGKVSSVTAPANQSGLRGKHTYTYTSTSATVAEADGATSPTIRSVTFDSAGRLLSDTDAAGVATNTTWNNDDQPTSVVDGAGFKTTNLYDSAKRPTTTYGPALPSCFNPSNTPNGTCTGTSAVAVSTTTYDGGMNGLAATYWDNESLAGPPRLHGTINQPGLVVDWGFNAPSNQVGNTLTDAAGASKSNNWSARFTGEVQLDQTGLYQLYAWSDDGVRIYLDDLLMAEDWSAHPYRRTPENGTVFNNTVAGSRHRIRVDYFDNIDGAHLELSWKRPDGVLENIPGARMYPRYGLVTSTVDPDGQRTDTGFGNEPELGLAKTVTADPLGKNLTTTTSYESRGSGYSRRLSRTLPGGGTSSHTYYDTTNPSSGSTCSIAYAESEKGMLRSVTGPSGTAGATTTRYFAYDLFGRIAGTRVNNDAWSCVTYDNRGRPETQTDSSGKQSTIGYASANGVPLRTTLTYRDSDNVSRTTITESDLLGRQFGYTDELGTRAGTVFDQSGRVASTTRQFAGQSAAPLTENTYNATTRRLATTIDYSGGTGRTTTFGYDAAGRPTTTSLPNGVVSTTGYDGVRGRLSSLVHAKSGTTYSNSTYTRSKAGDITAESGSRARTYTYDGVGRLTSTVEGATTRRYAYDAHSNRCGLAATCDGQWGYDAADRMTASPYGSNYVYDAHGNLTSYKKAGALSSAPFNHPFTYASGDADRTYSFNVGSGGSLNAQADWTGTAATRTSTATGNLAKSGQSGSSAEARTPAPEGASYVSSTFTYGKSLHSPTTTTSYSLAGSTSQTKTITTDGAGAINASATWAAANAAYPAAAGTVGTATSMNAPSFTTTGNGTVSLTLTWKATAGECAGTAPAGPPPKLDLALMRGTTQVATTNTAVNQNQVTLTYSDTSHTTYPTTTTYTPVVKSTTAGCAWTLTGTFPKIDTVKLELINSSGTVLSSATSASDVPSVAVSTASAPAGTYSIKLTAGPLGAPGLTLSESHQTLNWANVALELRDPGGGLVKSGSASGGTVTVDHETTGGGAYYWRVANNSADLTAPGYTWNTSAIALAPISANFSVPVTPTATTSVALPSFVADAAGPAHVKATWGSDGSVTGGVPTLTLKVVNVATGATVGTPTTGTGSVDFTASLPAGGTYRVDYTTQAGSTKTATGTVTTTFPKTPVSYVSLKIFNASNTQLASASGATTKPVSVSASNLPKGTYRVVATTVGSGSATLTGSYTDVDPNVTFTYDANDHATKIDDGAVTTAETLSPAGRVLRRRVTNNASGAVVEDIDYGYDDSGDSPAYMLPHGATTPITTYVGIGGGVAGLSIGNTITYQHANSHGDILGTTDASGVWTASPTTDEFGVGGVPSSRLGWLGSHQRFTTSVSTGIVRMGVRLYDPKSARFLSVDPIEGGCSNDYVYVNDPVNEFDLDGMASRGDANEPWCKGSWRHPSRANQCRLARRAANFAEIHAARLARDGAQNALRHCLWAGVMTMDMGSSAAFGFLSRHERGSKDAQDTLTDWRNNRVGMRIGGRSSSRSQVRRRCLAALRSGALDTSSGWN